MNNSIDEMLESFRSRLGEYNGFAESVRYLLSVLLKSHNISPHSIYSRVKAIDSLLEKLSRDGKHYTSIEGVTDLVGLRIITFYPEDVDAVAKVVRGEFAIDEANSIDKRELEDRFGYSSLHLVAHLPEKRTALIEYSNYREMKCEIQIRSILQHAWAEIEHDLGYKAPKSLPLEMRRRFAKIAALLEVADDEFMRLRVDGIKYLRSVQQKLDVQGGTLDVSHDVEIDEISLLVAVQDVPEIATIERLLQELPDGLAPFSTEIDKTYVAGFVDDLKDCQFTTIGMLRDAYIRRIDKFLPFWSELSKFVTTEVPKKRPGRSLALLIMLFLGETVSEEDAKSFFTKHKYGPEKFMVEAFKISQRIGQGEGGGEQN